jgi:hypothetical protein
MSSYAHLAKEPHVFEAGAIRNHLLGTLNQELRVLLEELLITDESQKDETEEGSYEELILAVEDELIDDFVRDRLSPEDNERFRRNFLGNPERRWKILFASALGRYVDSAAAAQAPARGRARRDPKHWFSWLWDWTAVSTWSYARAAAVALVLVGGAWMFAGKLRVENQVDQMLVDRVELEKQLDSLRGRVANGHGAASIPKVWLSPGLIHRGLGQVERVNIPRDTSLVRVQLDLGIDDYESYRASLHDASGDEFWVRSRLHASESGERVALIITLPSELIPCGDYYFRVSGVSSGGDLELVGRYHFRVLEE